MKKLILISFTLILFAFSSNAQTKKDGTPDMRYKAISKPMVIHILHQVTVLRKRQLRLIQHRIIRLQKLQRHLIRHQRQLKGIIIMVDNTKFKVVIKKVMELMLLRT